MFAPFAGVLFDPERIVDPASVTSPPYDVIDEPERHLLEGRSPFNIVRVLLAEPGDERYQAAARLLRSWRDAGVLVADPAPRFYLYEIEYPSPAGAPRRARGVLGALDLLEFGDAVLPHEETMDATRADRMAVLRATEANLDPILALSSSPRLAELLEPVGEPRIDFAVEGIRHRLYTVALPEHIDAIRRAVSDSTISIADGHHRYVTARAYRAARHAVDGSGPWDAIMAVVAPAEGSGFTVGPYHRVFRRAHLDVSRLERSFELHSHPATGPQRAGDLVLVRPDHAPLLLRPRPAALERLPEPWREAGAAIAREVLYPLIGVAEDDAEYVPDEQVAMDTVTEHHPDGVAILTSPVTEHAIAAASAAGICFPQKTTFFVPKPRAGLVLRCFSG